MTIERTFLQVKQGLLPSDADKATPLMHACAAGDVSTAKSHLSSLSRHEINHTDSLLGNALNWAVNSSNTLLVKVLLEAGAWPNQGSRVLGLPLQQAVQSGQCDIIRLLRAAGADSSLSAPQPFKLKYDYGTFVCLDIDKRAACPTPADLAKQQEVIDALQSHDDGLLTLPTATHDAAEVEQLIKQWRQNAKHAEALGHVVNNTLNTGQLREMRDLVATAQTPARKSLLFKDPHTESRQALLQGIEKRLTLITPRSAAAAAPAA